MQTDYLRTTIDVYRAAAEEPDDSLCCVSTPPWRMPDLTIPQIMHDMNYGCGTTVHPRDVPTDGPVLYIGVGGGLELIQFAALTRRAGGVIGVDPVQEMLDVCETNFSEARGSNGWLTPPMVELRAGDALELPVESDTVGLVAQNCLFNTFKGAALEQALREAHRGLRPGAALSLSDPFSNTPIPAHLRDDARLRALCLSGALPLDDYLSRIVAAGFGTIEVRGRRPYRLMDRSRYALDEHILLESVEVVAYKTPVPADGPCIFTGRTAIWFGESSHFDDGKGHVLRRDVPMGVCDKTALALAALDNPHLILTPSTWHYDGGGCC